MQTTLLEPEPVALTPSEAIELFVFGKPEPAGSKKSMPIYRKGGKPVIVNGRIMVNTIDDNPNSKGWKQEVKAAAFSVYRGQPMEGPLRLTLVFIFVRPKCHFGTGRNEDKLKPSAPEWFGHVTKPDTLKVTRGVEDALTGVVWKDDCQVVQESLMKCYGPTAGVLIRIERFAPTEFETELYRLAAAGGG
jgi:Holliday junction resolvase RusA-like endonuclease